MKETKCQESSKPLGQVEDEIMKTGAQFVGEEILKKIQKKKKLKRKDLIPVLLSRADLEKIKEEVKMTILGEMLRDDFIEEGRQEGRQENQERYNRLILCLDKDGKTSLIVKAASDPQLLEKLFQEYGI